MSYVIDRWWNPHRSVTETRFPTTAGADVELLLLLRPIISLSLDLVNFITRFQRRPDKEIYTSMFCRQVTLIVAIGGADHMLVGFV